VNVSPKKVRRKNNTSRLPLMESRGVLDEKNRV